MADAATQATWAEVLTAERMPRLALVCLGIWLNAADALVTATAMPSIARDIGGYAFFAWPVAVYLFGAILGGAYSGRLSERNGLHVALTLSAGLYAVGCIIGALSHGMNMFLIGRLLQGGGAGMTVGLCYVSAGALFPGELWRRVLTLLSMVWGVATILGPLLGGLFAEAGAWRLLFWFFAAQAFLFAAAAWKLVPHRQMAGAGGRVPAVTLGWLGPAILFFLLAGIVTDERVSAVMLAAGVGLLFITLRLDASTEAHLLPREVSDIGHVSGQGYAAIFLLAAASIGFSVYGAALFQALFGLSPLAAGYMIGAEALGWTGMAVIVAELPHSADRRAIRIGAAVIVASIVSLSMTPTSGVLLAVFFSAVGLGAGFGVSWAFLTRRIVDHLPPVDRGIGSSAIPTVQMVGNAVGSAIAGLVANALGAAHGIGPGEAATIAPWLFIAATPLGLIGWLFAWCATRARS